MIKLHIDTMSCIQQVRCELTDNKEVYRSGETVSGQWNVTVDRTFRVTGIMIKLVGMIYVKWNDGLGLLRDNIPRGVITNQRLDVLENVNCE